MTSKFMTPQVPTQAASAAIVPSPVDMLAVPVDAIVETAPVIEATLTLADAFPARRERPKAFYVASQWHIVPTGNGDVIDAVNNTTGDRYEGPISDFNDMLRGD